MSQDAYKQLARLPRMAAALIEATDLLSAYFQDLRDKNNLEELLKLYAGLRDEYEAVDEARKRLNATILEVANRTTVPEMMQERNVRTISLADIRKRFTYQTRISASMPDKDGGMGWLESNGFGDLIQKTVNSSSLSAFAKSYIQEHGKDLPEEYFKISSMFVTSVTKL